ncbi:MAG: DUF2961 domain-containing protein [Armatimonadota bacterium]|nr:DUF2961 domain-containing protein [Armatimonadota bacterium]
MSPLRFVLLFLALAVFTISPVMAAPVGMDTLLRQETDLSGLPLLRAWTMHLDSSHAPDGGNDDAQHFVSFDGHTAVLADLTGPGAVVRLWSANAGGQLKIYIDDNPTPVLDAPFPKLFDGSLPPFVAPLSQNASGGFISYVPIPYAKHCRITVDDPKGLYYQVNSVAYPPGTEVRSFALPLAAPDQAALDATVAAWGAAEQSLAAPERWGVAAIAPGGERPLTQFHGPAVIQALRMQFPGADDSSLRRLVLRAYFDGHKTPDIAAPVADFFGNAFGRLPFQSLLLGQRADGTLESRFPMPFGRSARFTLENGTGGPVTVRLIADVARQPFDAKRTGYFHAQWFQEMTKRGVPHLWAQVWGQRGHFVGIVQTMSGPHGLGFLEGDEQFRVDGERMMPGKVKTTVVAPWNGTGTEDCFNGGWYFLGHIPRWLPLNGILVRDDDGRINTFRFFLNDAPVFQQSLDAQIEHGGVNDAPGVYYSSVAFWYANGPAQLLAAMPSAAQLALPQPPPPRFVLPGVIEGESLIASATQTGGNVQTQEMGQYAGDWSRDAHLWWTNTKVGDTLTLPLSVPAAGEYDIIGYFTRAADYGQFRFQISGQALPTELDAYHDVVAPSGPVTLGRVTLPAGKAEFQITVSGKNPKSTNTLFGLDALRLQPAPPGHKIKQLLP